MKQGWEIKILEDVVEFQRGLTYSKKDEVDFSDNIVLRSNNVDLIKNELDLTELKYINPAIEIQESKKVKKGSLLICTANGSKSHLGKVALIDDDYNYAFGGFMGQVTQKEKLDSKFLFYLMTSDNYKKFINELSDGANINNLKFSDLGQFEIPLPPLPEQQRIVSILDEAFAAIAKAKANAEQNLQNAKELFESYLQGVFEKKGDGWISSTIGETCKLMTGGTPSTTKKEYYDGGNIKWLVSGDINQKEIFDCEGRITELGLENSNARYIPVNSVLIALNGQGKTRGTVAMLRTEATCNQSLVSIYPNDVNKVLPELIYANLDGRYNEIRKLTGDSGNDRRGLNMPIIRNISFSYPKSLAEQQTIVRQLDALRAETQKLEAVYRKKIVDLEELKKSVLQKAFNGEL